MYPHRIWVLSLGLHNLNCLLSSPLAHERKLLLVIEPDGLSGFSVSHGCGGGSLEKRGVPESLLPPLLRLPQSHGGDPQSH